MVMKRFRIALLCAALIQLPSMDGTSLAAEARDGDAARWGQARAVLLKMLEKQGRDEADLEQPRWYETPYMSVGHMPLIDRGLEHPLDLPMMAMVYDERARFHGETVLGALHLADELADMSRQEGAHPLGVTGEQLKALPEDIREYLAVDLKSNPAPVEALEPFATLVHGAAVAHVLREKALSGLSTEERARLTRLLPQYLLPEKNGKTVFRAYTASDLKECEEVLRLARRVDMKLLLASARCLAWATGRAIELLGDFRGHDGPSVIVDRATSMGRIVLGNRGPNSY
ncbi:MAG: hypothetical protein ACYTFG_08175, partial [Planctomycetota bacterium]